MQIKNHPREPLLRITMSHMQPGLTCPQHDAKDILHSHGYTHLFMSFNPWQINKIITVQSLRSHANSNAASQSFQHFRFKRDKLNSHAGERGREALAFKNLRCLTKSRRITK